MRDVSEILSESGLTGPLHPVKLRVAYHDACHLAHGQRVRSQPRSLLAAIPGLTLVPLQEAPALLDEIRLARGANRRLDAWTARLEAELADPADAELRARRLVERIALALQASLLVRGAPGFVADAFCAARLGDADGIAGLQFGSLPQGVECGRVVERAGTHA